MQPSALLKQLYRPKWLAVCATVTVASLFVAGLGWLEVTKLARRKIEAEVAKLSKRIGRPIEIGKWRVGLGGAFFEDIVVGPDAAVVVSRVTAEVGMNPFAADFGKLESIVVHKIRLKQGLKAFQNDMATLKEPASRQATEATPPEGRGAAALKAVEKLFQALPTNKLLVRSGALTVVDENGNAALTVRGLRLLIEKPTSKVLFQIGSVRVGAGLVEQSLDGRFELMPKDAAYRFFVRRRASERQKLKGWSVAGRLKKDLDSLETDFDLQAVPAPLLAFVPDLDNMLGKDPALSLKGRLKAGRDADGVYGFDATMTSAGTRITLPLISNQPLGPVQLGFAAKGRFDPASSELALDEAHLDFPAGDAKGAAKDAKGAHFTIEAAGTFPSLAMNEIKLRASVTLAETDCQTILDASPPGLLPALKDFKLSGTAQAALDVTFDGQNPENIKYDLHDAKYGCKVKSTPALYSPEHLAGPFTVQRQVSKDDEPLEVSVSPMKPGFTPLAQVSRNVSVAFTTSEDAAFYLHKGIDTFAIDSALRRNLAEKRVAVGGSTITMQTAKNLFLNQERTISRKLQELFLAWHLENVLDKERILEIYVNIVELGPGIYGVTQASEHFFGKHPFDLTLMESAYLAALLPSPKARYQYFCEGRLTPAFQDMVFGILKRMVNLNRIPYERYYQAMSAGIHFNDQARVSARDCSRRSWAQQRGAEKDPEPTVEATGRSPRATE